MLTQINDWILSVADPALNWLLSLSSDVALIIVGVVTGAIITLARPLTTNKLFGLVPGIPFLYMPPWLLAYFLIAIPSVSLTKRVLRIY